MSPVRMPAAPSSGTAPSETDKGAADQPGSSHAAPRPWLVVGGVFVLVALPLVVAAGALRRPQWYPVLDLAMTELRLRDVGTSQTPLIGLPGRIGPSLAEQGSHPGPLSFYLLAPLYRVLGSSSWAMQASTVVLNLVALGAALAVAARRGGARLVIAVGALLMVLTSGYGLTVLTQPWNPYLPLLWWVVLLLAVWSVACDDLAMLPVAVFAGSLCAQTHVPYLGLALGLGAATLATLGLAWRRAAPGSRDRRRVARWGAASLALGVVLWLPPLVDQAINDPGNLRAIVDHVATPSQEPVGLGRGVELTLLHLDVSEFVTSYPGSDGSLLDASSDPTGSILPGLAVVAIWVVAAAASLRLGSRVLVQLHLVVAAGLVLGVVAIARIFGKEWFYLMLWAWGVAGLLLLAIGWTALLVVTSRLPPPRRRRASNAATAALLAVTVSGSVAFTAGAVDVDAPEPHLSSTLGQVVSPTVAALERGDGAATGRDGHYVVMWSDSFYFGSQGYGLVSELERVGFDAGTPGTWHVPITDHRVIEPADATAAIHFATGDFVGRWRAVPDALEVAYVEPRNGEQRAEFADLRSAVIDDLRADGLDDLVPTVDGNLFGASIDERVSGPTQRLMARMLELGERTAVFIAPPGTAGA